MIIIDFLKNFNNYVYQSKNYVWHQILHFHLKTNTYTLFILEI